MLRACLTNRILNLLGHNPMVSQGGPVLLGLHFTEEEMSPGTVKD